MVIGTTFDFKEYLTSRRNLVEVRLAEYLAHDDPAVLWESMRYSLLAGGKRLRAILCLASAEAATGDAQRAAELALPCACAIELVHGMSLIHDDLPALDNDDLRRGQPTNHKVYGEAIALLAGDALLALATEVLLQRSSSAVSPSQLLLAALELSKAIGANGMVGGQVADMCLTGLLGSAQQQVDAKLLESMHKRKTGALIRFSAWSGACLGGAGPQALDAIARFGELLGLAFQITDDLLDITGDIKVLGKTPGKDQASNKTTWVRFFGIDESCNQLKSLKAQALEALKDSGLKDLQALHCLLDYAIERVS